MAATEAQPRPKALPNAARATHTYLIGQSGAGKSKCIESLVLQDVLAGRGVGVIDPHGDLYRHLTRHLAARLPQHPGLAERVILLDPGQPGWTVSLNPLEAVAGLSPERLALFLTDVVVKVWKLDPLSAPRLVWLLTNTFLALASLGLSLLDLPPFLLHRSYRARLLPRVPQAGVRRYFAYEFPQTDGAAQQWVTPLLNKLGGLLFDPDVQLLLSGRPTFTFRDVLDRQLVFLANLAKGTLGEGTSALLGAFLVAHFQKAALARADSAVRPPFYLYLDEFQHYTTDSIQDILAESRKYGLSLTLAHQYLEQLPSPLRSAVLNTAGTLVCFRVGYHDARTLAREIFPGPDFLTRTEEQVKWRRLGKIPLPVREVKEEALGWEGLALELANLPPREFWVRRRGPYVPVRQRTLAMPDPPESAAMAAQLQTLLDASGQRYGRRKEEAARALKAGTMPSASDDGGRPQDRDDDGYNGDNDGQGADDLSALESLRDAK